jgi:hypothetical protein
MMEYDVHTLLDGMTLLATGGVVFCMTVQPEIKQTYQRDQDKLKFYYVVRREMMPCGRGIGPSVSSCWSRHCCSRQAIQGASLSANSLPASALLAGHPMSTRSFYRAPQD